MIYHVLCTNYIHIMINPLFSPILALSWSLFHAKCTWERDRFASFDSNTLILWLICVFKENIWVLRTKIAFTRSWRKNRRQTKHRESKRKQKERCTTVQGEARPCCRARKVARLAARPCCRRTCDRASTHGLPCGPAPSCVVRNSQYNVGFLAYLGGFHGLGFQELLIRVSLSLSQTPLGGNKLGWLDWIRVDFGLKDVDWIHIQAMKFRFSFPLSLLISHFCSCFDFVCLIIVFDFV